MCSLLAAADNADTNVVALVSRRRGREILRDKTNSTVGFVNFFESSLSLPWQHGPRQQFWYISGTHRKQLPNFTVQFILSLCRERPNRICEMDGETERRGVRGFVFGRATAKCRFPFSSSASISSSFAFEASYMLGLQWAPIFLVYSFTVENGSLQLKLNWLAWVSDIVKYKMTHLEGKHLRLTPIFDVWAKVAAYKHPVLPKPKSTLH